MIAHECGHQAFSDYQAVNDGVGLAVHSCLLVPYYSWKHSHRRHHSNTGSLAKDEVRACACACVCVWGGGGCVCVCVCVCVERGCGLARRLEGGWVHAWPASLLGLPVRACTISPPRLPPVRAASVLPCRPPAPRLSRPTPSHLYPAGLCAGCA